MSQRLIAISFDGLLNGPYPLMSLTINGSAWNVLKENAFYFGVIRHSILRKIEIYKKFSYDIKSRQCKDF